MIEGLKDLATNARMLICPEVLELVPKCRDSILVPKFRDKIRAFVANNFLEHGFMKLD
jgi:hypothetical protein